MTDKLREAAHLVPDELENHCAPLTTEHVKPSAKAILPGYKPAQQDAQAESSIVGQNKLLADALASCILASGIVRKDIDGLTGPQLLLFAEDLREMLEAKSAQQDEQAVSHLKKLLHAMHQESNAKHNLNEWLRASPAFAQRAAQAEAEWVVAVKHLVAAQMEAQKYVEESAALTPPAQQEQPAMVNPAYQEVVDAEVAEAEARRLRELQAVLKQIEESKK